MVVGVYTQNATLADRGRWNVSADSRGQGAVNVEGHAFASACRHTLEKLRIGRGRPAPPCRLRSAKASLSGTVRHTALMVVSTSIANLNPTVLADGVSEFIAAAAVDEVASLAPIRLRQALTQRAIGAIGPKL
jgi:hypothetical protein